MKAIRILGAIVLVGMLVGMVLGTACAGKQGVGIESIEDNNNGTFTVTLTDGSTFTSSDLTGPQGPQSEKGDKGDTGAQGPQGIQGPAGTMPVMAWHNIATFSGIDGMTTSSFNVPADDFRLTYLISTDNNDYPFFAVNIIGTTTPLAGVIWEDNFTLAKVGIEYIRDGRQQFYLGVYAANLTDWAIYVDALY